MAACQLRREKAAAACAKQEGSERDQRRDDRQAAAAGDPETEKYDVPGHVRGEDMAEPEIADRVHQAGCERQHQERPSKRVPDASAGALS
jgi:hypothetical protein